MDELALSQHLRPSCTVCGSSGLSWARADVASETARLPSQRAAFVSYLASPGASGTDSAWWCDRCDQVGAFGPAMMG